MYRVLFWIQVISLLCGTAPILAQGIRHVDYYGTQRGQQIAKSCFENYHPYSESYECLSDALRRISKDNDDFAALGFTYYAFIIRGLHQESVRTDPREPAQLKQSERKTLKGSQELLEILQRKLFVPFTDLCKITQTDCEVANRLEQYWRTQTS